MISTSKFASSEVYIYSGLFAPLWKVVEEMGVSNYLFYRDLSIACKAIGSYSFVHYDQNLCYFIHMLCGVLN